LNLKIERRVGRILAPHMSLLDSLGKEGLDGLGELVAALAEDAPEAIAAVFESQGVTVEFLDEYSHTRQLIPVIMAQLDKLGLADILGNASKKKGRGG